MTATRSMEKAFSHHHTTEDKLHRGRNLVLAFLMQGWGQLLNVVILIIFLLILNDSTKSPYSKTTSQWLFRLSFVPPLISTLWLIYYRYFKVDHADTVLNNARRRAKVTGYDKESFLLCCKYYWGRLLGTSLTWFANDFLFYGNRIFQGDWTAALAANPTDDIGPYWLWALLNIGCAMVGYYLGAILIGKRRILNLVCSLH
jgi:hypothetical protein